MLSENDEDVAATRGITMSRAIGKVRWFRNDLYHYGAINLYHYGAINWKQLNISMILWCAGILWWTSMLPTDVMMERGCWEGNIDFVVTRVTTMKRDKYTRGFRSDVWLYETGFPSSWSVLTDNEETKQYDLQQNVNAPLRMKWVRESADHSLPVDAKIAEADSDLSWMKSSFWHPLCMWRMI